MFSAASPDRAASPPVIIMLQIVEGFESAAREKGIRARALEVKLCCI